MFVENNECHNMCTRQFSLTAKIAWRTPFNKVIWKMIFKDEIFRSYQASKKFNREWHLQGMLA